MQNFDMDKLLETLTSLTASWGLKVVGAIGLLIVGLIVAKMVRGGVRRGLERASVDATLVPFLSRLVYYIALALVLIAVLGVFGVETTSFAAVLGAAGLAVGLALQGTLSNFAAGVMLLLFRPFKVEDYVEAGGTAGTVQEIGVFATRLHTPDNVLIVVPNSAIWGATIKNYSVNATRRNDMVVGVSYNDDLGKVRQVILDVLAADPRVFKDPEPVVAVSELADSSVNFVVRPWCTKEDYWDLRWDLTRAFKEQLEAAGCSIPYPQNDVHVHQAA